MDSSRLQKELQAGREHKRPRVTKHWSENDKAYNGEVPKYSKLPYNFHLPILSGFEDTLVSKLSDSPNVAFGSGQAGETRLGRQMDALWKQQSDRPDYDYGITDIVSKRHAARYGRAFHKTVGTKKPFSIDILAIDPYDMITDPNGGGDLEDHRFTIQDGIFRTKKQLLDGVESGLYDKKSVAQLLAGPGDSKDAYKTESDTSPRWAALNQSGYGYECAGEKLYRLAEHVTIEDGERMMVIWNPESGVILSQKTLKRSYGCDLLPWTSWAPYHDSKVFWSKAPDDDVRGAAEAMRVTLMEMLVNVQRQNWGTRMYDPSRVSAADLMISAPNGLIPTKSGTADMPGGLAGSYQVIQTPSVTIAANVVEFLDRFTGQKSGVTPDAQGSSTEDKVGIYFGNIEQLADRMGLQSKWYRNCWRKNGTRFLYQAKRNLSGKVPVQVLGARGTETTLLLSRNIDPTLGITVTGGSAEAAVSEAKRKERGTALSEALMNPLFQTQVNPQAAITEKLKSAGFEDDEIKVLLNKDAGSEYRDQQLRAQENVEKLLEGKYPPLYQGATVVYVQSILDSAKSFTDGAGPEHEQLIAYAQAHLPLAARNSALAAAEKANLMGTSFPDPSLDPQNGDLTAITPPDGAIPQAPQEGLISNALDNVEVR